MADGGDNDDRRHALIFNAITRGLAEADRFATLSEREAIARRVGQALDTEQTPRGLLGALEDRMMPRPDGPTLVYVTQGPAPMVCQIDEDNFDPGVLSRWDLAVCKALLDLALTKIEQHEREASTGVSRIPARLPEPHRQTDTERTHDLSHTPPKES